MANSKSPVLRVVVPVILAGLGLVVAWAVWRNTTPPGAPPQTAPAVTPAPAATPAASGSAAAPAGQTPPSTEQPSAPAAEQTPPAALPPLVGLRARTVEGTLTPDSLAAIGNVQLDPALTGKMRVAFNPIGAGIESIKLVEHFTTVDRLVNDEVQGTLRYRQNGIDVAVPPMAAL
jgi:hypothetical protein